jgi:hypothetical protein
VADQGIASVVVSAEVRSRIGGPPALIAVLVAGLTLFVSCASPPTKIPSASKTVRTETGSPGRFTRVPEIDWEDPFNPFGIKITDSSQAQLPFIATDPPTTVGSVVLITAIDPSRGGAGDPEIAWLIRNDAGQFLLEERATNKSQDQLNTAASCQPGEVGCSTIGWSLVDVGGSGPALLIDGTQTTLGSSATSVTWLDDGVEFLLLGPIDTFSATQAVTIAKQIIEA